MAAHNREIKHGRYTKEAIENRRIVNQLLREAMDTIMEIEEITI